MQFLTKNQVKLIFEVKYPYNHSGNPFKRYLELHPCYYIFTVVVYPIPLELHPCYYIFTVVVYSTPWSCTPVKLLLHIYSSRLLYPPWSCTPVTTYLQ